MTTDRRRAWVAWALALAFLVPLVVQAAGGQPARGSPASRAVAFVRTLGRGDFQAAEADFTAQMRQAAPPDALREYWQQLLEHMGPFQDTGATKTVVQDGYTTVIVKTDFKSRALGIAVSFDSARRIAGVHFVPPP